MEWAPSVQLTPEGLFYIWCGNYFCVKIFSKDDSEIVSVDILQYT